VSSVLAGRPLAGGAGHTRGEAAMTSESEAPAWRPILAGGGRAQVLAVVSDIAEALREPAQRAVGPSLWDGGAGVAVFFAYLHQALPGRGYDEGREARPGLLQGAAGIGLVLLAAAAEVAPAWDSALLLSPWHGRKKDLWIDCL